MKHLILILLIFFILLYQFLSADTAMNINYIDGGSKAINIHDIENGSFSTIGGEWFLNVYSNSGLEGISIRSIENIVFSENSSEDKIVIETKNGNKDTISLSNLYEILFPKTSNIINPHRAASECTLWCSPNPFQNKIKIEFFLSDISYISLSVYDLNGKEIIKLISGMCNSGMNQMDWSGIDSHGKICGSGYYMIVLNIEGYILNEIVLFSK